MNNQDWTVIPVNKFSLQSLNKQISEDKGGKFILIYLDEDPLSSRMSPKQFFQVRGYRDEEVFESLDRSLSQDELISKFKAQGVINAELVYYKLCPLKSILSKEWDLSLYKTQENMLQMYGSFTFDHLFIDVQEDIIFDINPNTMAHLYCLKRYIPNLRDLNMLMVNEVDNG